MQSPGDQADHQKPNEIPRKLDQDRRRSARPMFSLPRGSLLQLAASKRGHESTESGDEEHDLSKAPSTGVYYGRGGNQVQSKSYQGRHPTRRLAISSAAHRRF